MDATRCINGCDVPYAARGFCRRCYGRAWRQGLLEPLPPRDGMHALSQIDIEAKTATCSICGPESALRVRVGPDKRRTECMAAYRASEARRPKRKKKSYPRYRTAADRRLQKYGLTQEAYEALLLKQANLCAICGAASKLVVDHDHDTGEVRGLLCHPCNVSLGFMRDKSEAIRRAAAYLEQAS